jgi:hypothetical protein
MMRAVFSMILPRRRGAFDPAGAGDLGITRFGKEM